MITLIMDLENKCWHKSGTADSPEVVVEFYLDMNPVNTQFKNFGHEFTLLGRGAESIDDQPFRVTVEAEVPEESEEYGHPTVFPFLVERHVIKNLYPEEEYILDLMFKNRREVIEDTFSFTVPRPQSPYDSWVWDSSAKEWAAPVPPPLPLWDEESKQWIIP